MAAGVTPASPIASPEPSSRPSSVISDPIVLAALKTDKWREWLLGDAVELPDGTPLPVRELTGKYLILYWNDHGTRRAGAQRATTGALVDYYSMHNERLNFEVIWLPVSAAEGTSGDRMREWRARMPWPTCRMGSATGAMAASILGVDSGYSMVVLDPDGNVCSRKALEAIALDPLGAEFPYLLPDAIELLLGTAYVEQRGGERVPPAEALGRAQVIGFYLTRVAMAPWDRCLEAREKVLEFQETLQEKHGVRMVVVCIPVNLHAQGVSISRTVFHGWLDTTPPAWIAPPFSAPRAGVELAESLGVDWKGIAAGMILPTLVITDATGSIHHPPYGSESTLAAITKDPTLSVPFPDPDPEEPTPTPVLDSVQLKLEETRHRWKG